MFELCIIVDCICGFCALDKEQKLRCGYATGENHIKNMKSCPNKKMKKRATITRGSYFYHLSFISLIIIPEIINNNPNPIPNSNKDNPSINILAIQLAIVIIFTPDNILSLFPQ